MNLSDKSYERVPVENPDQIPAPNPTPNPVTNPTPDNQTKSEMKSRESSNNTVIQQQPTKQSDAEKDPPPSYPAELLRQPAYNYQQPGTQTIPQGENPQPGMLTAMGQQMLGMQMINQRMLAMQMMSQQAAGMPAMTATGPAVQTVPKEWVPTPERPPDCTPGLEYLCNLDNLFVHQEIDMVELMSGIEENNKYSIVNGSGQQIYYAVEDTPFMARNFGGAARAFDMKIMDKDMNEVIHLRRDLGCGFICIPCCLQIVHVYSPPGVQIGTVKQCCSCKPSFRVKNDAGKTVLRIKGPFLVCEWGEITFQLLSKKGDTTVGNIRKEWAGHVQEMTTNADNFNMSFPIDLDVKTKALLLGALFLIDFMYFENRPLNRNDRRY